MRLQKRIFATVMVLAGLLIDTSILPFTGIDTAYAPKLALLSVITIALLMGRTQGLIYGAIGGVVLDITLTVPAGLTSALYILGGFISGWFARKKRGQLVSSIVGPLLSLAVYELAFLGYYVFNAHAVAPEQLIAIVVRVALGVILVQPMYILFNLVLKPRRSRYAR